MNETLDYIESYFENGLTAEERMRFEQRISTDTSFANEVAFYIQARQALRNELVQDKEKSWQSVPAVAPKLAPVIPIKKPSPLRRWMAVAAGVVVVLGISIAFLLSNTNSAVQLAKSYSDSAFEQLSLTMDASRDSLQQGIAAYNAGKWDEAEKLFDGIYTAHPDTLEALRLSGIVSFKKKNYDKAISRFHELATHQELFFNPGLFYQGITLLIRNSKGDKEQARLLLQQVVNGNLDGSKEANKMLQELK